MNTPSHRLTGDFFADDWIQEAGVGAGQFDLIFDYTVRTEQFRFQVHARWHSTA